MTLAEDSTGAAMGSDDPEKDDDNATLQVMASSKAEEALRSSDNAENDKWDAGSHWSRSSWIGSLDVL